MPMMQVGATPKTKMRNANKTGVRSTREITRVKNRIQPRQELPERLLTEFVRAINDACDSGQLPYPNYRLNQDGSPNKVHAHYMCDKLDPVHMDTARKLAQKDKISIEEAIKYLEGRLLDKRYRGLAFILTSDAKSFLYRPVGDYVGPSGEIVHNYEVELYHNIPEKGSTGAEKRAAMTKFMRELSN